MNYKKPNLNKSSTKYLLKRLIKNYVKKHFKKLFLALFCMIIVSAATAIHAWMMQPVLDDIFLNKNASMLLILPIAVLLISITKGFASYFQSVLMNFIGFRIVADVQSEMFASIMRCDLSFFNDNNSGTLVSRFIADVGSLTRGVHSVLTNIIKDFLTILFLISVMFYHDWKLAILAFVVFPISIVPIIKIGKRIRKISTQTQVGFGELTSKLNQVFTGIKTIKSFNNQELEKDDVSFSIEKIFNLTFKSNKISSIARPLMETLGGLAIAGIIFVGGSQVIEGTTTPGTFFSFITALLMAYQPVKSLASLNTTLQTAMASAQRVFSIIDIKPKIVDKGIISIKKNHLQRNKGIKFSNINFKYSNSKNNIIKNCSFEIPFGKKIALVGPSGSGKTTLLNLIPRFYEPQSGYITIFDEDIKKLKLKELRNSLSIVSQDITLFDGTIKYNITYGSEYKTEDEIKKACEKSGCDEFISKLPEKLNTEIGENGVKLSGGQRQRIAIARAFLKNSPFLLLDEATSSLDSASEAKIQKALKELMVGRTSLVIAHRLSTINDADKIIVINDGKIVDCGKHQELILKCKIYKNLYKLQFKKNEKDL
ncbi:MAG: ABC transporter permease [Rickettsiales bacterium]|nr:ABC transporter permease [Rickettsiales bacterium]